MKTTLDLPDELVREVKLRAVVQGRTVKDLVADLLRESLGLPSGDAAAKPPASRLVEAGDHGLPVIPCKPNAPATRMKAKDLLRLEAVANLEEDLQRGRRAH